VPEAAREHDDVDLAVAEGQLQILEECMNELGYTADAEQSVFRPQFRLIGSQEVVVQGAALRFGDEFACMSVTHNREDRWLRCRREWFPEQNDGTLGGTGVRCARPEALLVSKLSSLPLKLSHTTRLFYAKDAVQLMLHLRLTPAEARCYEKMAVPLEDCQCVRDYPRKEPDGR
jgi:hypothetical protein